MSTGGREGEGEEGGGGGRAGRRDKTWWIRLPLTETGNRSEEPGFGNRRGRGHEAGVMEAMRSSVWGLRI